MTNIEKKIEKFSVEFDAKYSPGSFFFNKRESRKKTKFRLVFIKPAKI